MIIDLGLIFAIGSTLLVINLFLKMIINSNIFKEPYQEFNLTIGCNLGINFNSNTEYLKSKWGERFKRITLDGI
ncbi:hypothetical protein CP985_14120 [Malaciobacter mytili LMG 24559]|uniref:Uncharacterized protein n=1 Tax=Malaciobacter mytili LMG 24559 TaxID=1032238 RepID=A0AAX2ACH9_9BACT|nr:hypothetical protein [Malaciobacter mytili]AXH16479.1 hypothetical protein AMYT_a0181 [Malaciobacter mytili LMG 24559]RXK12883.1 hypothetical protein CP985_14120 [Malaciobacter mytili LMG 24559]